MKKNAYSIGKALALVLVISLLVPALASCKLYDGDYKKSGDFEFKLDKKETHGTLTSWHWDGDPENSVIDVPDDYNGIPIDALGGAYGTNAPILAFVVETDCDVPYKGLEESKYEVPVSFEKIVFTLKLGKNIGEIHTQYVSGTVRKDANYIGVTQEDGSVIFYQVFFEVECSQKNKTYYSEDGKLYNSSDNKKVDSLPHMDDLK
ncbi:MAG: hypothetical protein J5379_03125 [Clostridiales bacterium]|nr:hypothetical protein [Clostridiales bacterium]